MATFGLAYNMMDRTGIEYPILATDWTSISWTLHVNHSGKIQDPSSVSPGAAEGKNTTPLDPMIWQRVGANMSEKSF